MEDIKQVCPKCDAEMERGFVLDFIHGRTGRIVSQWAAGVPHSSIWTGTKMPEVDLIPIGAYRCSACGLLECYARSEFAAK